VIVIPTVFVGRLRVGVAEGAVVGVAEGAVVGVAEGAVVGVAEGAVVGVGLFVASGAADDVEVGDDEVGDDVEVEVGSTVAAVGDIVGGIGEGLGDAASRTTSVPPVGARVLPVYRSYGYEPATG